MNNKISKNRIIALISLISFLTVLIFSSAFVLTHADHEHDYSSTGEACSICVQIQGAENIFKYLGAAFFCALFVIGGLYAIVKTIKAMAVCAVFSNPITLKIRINT